MNYAVVAISGKQFKITEGQEINIDRQDATKDSKMILSSVLLVRNDDKILLGAPYVPGVRIIAKVVGETKGDKIRVSKFKAKVHYRRSTGFRAQYTKLLIEKISLDKKVSSVSPEKPSKA